MSPYGSQPALSDNLCSSEVAAGYQDQRKVLLGRDQNSVIVIYQTLSFNDPFFIPLGENAIKKIRIVFNGYNQDETELCSITPFLRAHDIG